MPSWLVTSRNLPELLKLKCFNEMCTTEHKNRIYLQIQLTGNATKGREVQFVLTCDWSVDGHSTVYGLGACVNLVESFLLGFVFLQQIILVVQELVGSWFPFIVNIWLVPWDRERIFCLLLEFQRMETLCQFISGNLWHLYFFDIPS